MAVYKVIQDVEAEDKLVGFLTLKTFIYAIIAVGLAYVNFRLLIATDLGPARYFVVLLFLFPMLLFGLLAAPLGREQPTEVWVLSRVRFFIKPRKRIWDQSGISDLVTITAPKKPQRQLTKDFSQKEVRSRLKALATTIDSRGWAVKNVAVNLSTAPGYLDVHEQDSDRLVSPSSIMTKEEPIVDVHAADDILDEHNNATAQKLDKLMQKSSAEHKKQIKRKIATIRKGESVGDGVDLSFLDTVPPPVDEKGNTTFVASRMVAPGSLETKREHILDAAEQGFLETVHHKEKQIRKGYSNFKAKIHKPKATTKSPAKPTSVTDIKQADKLEELIQTAKDYPVKLSTLAQQAKRKSEVKQIGPNEVEIDLH